MCGIAGYIQVNRTEERVDDIVRMTRAVAHRGPDDVGYTLIDPSQHSFDDFCAEDSAPGLSGLDHIRVGDRHPHRIAFGHRRFTIVDTSVGGHQPFWTDDRGVCVLLNGELYNYVELRSNLEQLGHRFRSDSDTEVMARAFVEWGEACFERMNGFWSVALYDASRKAVLLARDRLGKAPLYVFSNERGIYWASEIKALAAVYSTSDFGINGSALTSFVMTGERDRRHETMYERVHSFPSASYAWIASDGSYDPVTYWSLPTTRRTRSEVDFDEAVRMCNELLHDSLRMRMRADVPVGFELSGGMDSSAIVGTAGHSFNTPVRAFTISWPDSPLNEEPFARSVAARFPNVEYNVITPPEDELMDDLDSFVTLMEQPFRTPSVFSYQSILRSMQAEGLRVSINGTGGDENFAGYAAYRTAYLRRLAQQRDIRAMIRELQPSRDGLTPHSPFELLEGVAALGLRKASRLFDSARSALPKSSPSRASGGFERPAGVEGAAGEPADIDELLIDYMGDGLMNYWQRVVNQTSMGVPMEVRSPFLDYRMIEFSFQLPLEYLMHNGWSKWILRHSMRGILPDDVTWRRQKSGFPFPLADWLRLHRARLLELLDTVESPYLDPARTRSDYDLLAGTDPAYLWRIVSVGLWWKRCVQDEALS